MQYSKLFFSLVFFAAIISLQAQQRNVREQVYMHVNTPYLLTGETFYFSGYVTSAATGKSSPLSSILYVELVGQGNEPVFQKKIKLQNGRGSGEFFVSSLVPTGSYQLVAYTRWMKNFNDYFQLPVTIINPFEEYEQPEQKEAHIPEISFYPEGGTLVSGKVNTVIYQTNEAVAKEAPARVVNSSGDKVAELEPGQDVGRFTFTPVAGESYQAIVEDVHGDFHFFDLPHMSTEGRTISLHNEKDAYRIDVLSNIDEQVRLKVSNGNQQVLAKYVYTNNSSLINKTELDPGLFYVQLEDLSGNLLSSRVFFHDENTELKAQEEQQLVFNTRSVVEIPLEFPSEVNVSVSVRRVDMGLESPGAAEYSFFSHVQKPVYGKLGKMPWEQLDNLMVMNSWRQQEDKEKNTVELLPELRSELIAGRIGSENGPVKNKLLAYTITGEEYQVQTAQTDEKGKFIIPIDPFTGEHEAYVTVLDQGSYSISVESPFMSQYPEFDYTKPYLDSATVAYIISRSVRNQIENAYYEFHKDSIIAEEKWQNQFGEFSNLYFLDDYNRFPEMYEHFIEYIPTVVARKNRNKAKIKVFLENMVPNQLDPFILLDGVPTSAKQVLDFSPYKIESIGVINNRFYLGPLVADGIVSLHTFEKDLQGFEIGDNALQVTYQGLDPEKKYFFPQYDTASDVLKRRPDYRDQLYWDPKVRVSAGSTYLLQFYTSDTEGIFEVSVQGFSKEGEPVSIKKTFKVASTNSPTSN